MSDSLAFLPEARQDIADAYEWYEFQTEGLGAEFIRCLDVAFSSIERHPLIYPVVHEKFRRSLIRRFPYAVFFETGKSKIVIYSVFHCSQNPKKWLLRSHKET